MSQFFRGGPSKFINIYNSEWFFWLAFRMREVSCPSWKCMISFPLLFLPADFLGNDRDSIPSLISVRKLTLEGEIITMWPCGCPIFSLMFVAPITPSVQTHPNNTCQASLGTSLTSSGTSIDSCGASSAWPTSTDDRCRDSGGKKDYEAHHHPSGLTEALLPGVLGGFAGVGPLDLHDGWLPSGEQT